MREIDIDSGRTVGSSTSSSSVTLFGSKTDYAGSSVKDEAKLGMHTHGIEFGNIEGLVFGADEKWFYSHSCLRQVLVGF